MESSLPLTIGFGLLALCGVGLGSLANLVARRSVVNPWVIGIVVLAVAGTLNGWVSVRAGLLETEDAFAQGERFGAHVAGPLALPLLLLAWRGRAYGRRGEGPIAEKGSFKFALGVLVGFMLLTSVLSAVLGTAVRRSAVDRAEQEKARVLARSVAQDSLALPKSVDEATVLFKITAEGLTLVNHYRLVRELKAEVDPAKVQAFRSAVLEKGCGNPATSARFLERGYAIRHSYYDKNDELIIVVEVTSATCSSLRK